MDSEFLMEQSKWNQSKNALLSSRNTCDGQNVKRRKKGKPILPLILKQRKNPQYYKYCNKINCNSKFIPIYFILK